jgi:hypothetical protein
MADVHGPIDVLLLEIPASADGAATATALRDLVEGGAVGLYDLAFIQ